MSEAVIENPDEIVCTLQFTMKLKDWKQIKKTLKTNPAYAELELIGDILDLVNQLENTLYSKADNSNEHN